MLNARWRNQSSTLKVMFFPRIKGVKSQRKMNAWFELIERFFREFYLVNIVWLGAATLNLGKGGHHNLEST